MRFPQQCFETKISGCLIVLHQNGVDRFSVTYGLQVDQGLNYAQAAAKLGEALMHALACDGKLDNREKGER